MMDTKLDEDVMKFLKEIGVGARSIHDPFFDQSYKVCKVFEKIGVILVDDETLCHRITGEFACNADGCYAVFDDLFNYEVHYMSTHKYTCSQCKKKVANARLLDIHIQETHDSFFTILSKKQPMYQCYIPSCEIKFPNAEVRKEHCVNIHKFPKNFKYNDGSEQKTKNKEVSEDLMEIDELTKKLSISKKPKANLYKNQKVKTFMPHMKNCNEAPKIETDLTPIHLARPMSTSSLVFIPRQLTHKPISKVPTQGKSTEKNVLEENIKMEVIDSS